VIAEAAGRVATLLEAHPVRASGVYPIGEVVRGLDAELAALRQAVADIPGPLGTEAPQVALLMMCLQHTVVLCHGYEELPDDLRAQVRRELATAHQTARRLR
jgi:threonine aldolase